LKKELTMDKLDALCERFENAPFKCGAWWPTIDEVKTHIEPRLDQNVEFLVWIAETADAPKNEQERESKRYINNLIYKITK
jgi:hypothetical protein